MFKAIFLQVATFANKFMVCLFFPASENFLKKKKVLCYFNFEIENKYFS